MTVKELIINLLEQPMDEEVNLQIKCNIIDEYGNRTLGQLFKIDDVEGTCINFTDWRAKIKNGNVD